MHPRKFCKCVDKAKMEAVILKYNSLLLRCKKPPEKWARCGGEIEKCGMYSPFNWSTCKCEQR